MKKEIYLGQKICRVKYEDNEVLKQIEKLTDDDKIVILLWIEEIEHKGPEAIKDDPKWRDHPLEREWKGCRASSFSHKGRIIYKIIEGRPVVALVEKITHEHNYKRGE